MYQRFEETMVSHCAATLARHKVGSLFNYKLLPGEMPEGYVALLHAALAGKGLEIRLLKKSEDVCLVYVYRPAMLAKLLMHEDIRSFLQGFGYTNPSMEDNIEHLSQRICLSAEFPHEIGIFLGYPLVDVQGFIEHRGSNFSCLGCWKAYSDAEDASKRFMLYHKCREVYLACYRKGMTITRLAVAA